MSKKNFIPKAYKREASTVVPAADIYKSVETPTGSSFKAADKLIDKIGSQMHINKSPDFWKDVASNFDGIVKDTVSNLTFSGDRVSFDKDKLMSTMKGQFGSVSFLNDLSDGQLNKIADYCNFGTLQMVYNNGTAIIDDLKGNLSAGGIMDAAKKLLGDVAGFDFINNSAIFGLANFVLDNLESSGLVDLFDDIIGKIEDNDTRVELIKQRAKSAAGESDISLCQHYVDKLGSDDLYSIKDDLLPLIVSSYRINNDDSRPYRVRAEEIVALMNKVYSSWYLENGITSTRYFHQMSEDCILVFSQLDNAFAPLAIACNMLNSDINATEVNSAALGVAFMEQ